MRHKTADVSTAKPDEGSLELTEDIIRTRAYQFYKERGYEDGHDLEDWFRAKGEIFGKKTAVAEKDTGRGTRAGVAVKATVVHFRRLCQGYPRQTVPDGFAAKQVIASLIEYRMGLLPSFFGGLIPDAGDLVRKSRQCRPSRKKRFSSGYMLAAPPSLDSRTRRRGSA